MLLYEFDNPTTAIINDFAAHAAAELGLTRMPQIKIKRDAAYSADNHTFGHYAPDDDTITLQISNRQILDILRTLAHELVHCGQDHRNELEADSGETGSAHENEANAVAGEIMRGYAQAHPELFKRASE
jgi:Zn-dependent peptidase ImmA (M78 family)